MWVGGRASGLRDAIVAELRSAGFEAEYNERLPGLDRANICNQTLSGEGVQLEIPRSLRRRLVAEADLLQAFRKAIRKAIAG